MKQEVINKVMRIIYRAAALTVFALSLPSCLKEDTTGCLREVRVYFNVSTRDADPSHIDRMHLYLFNREGYFCGEYRDDNITHFNSDYYISCIGLPPEEYRFIAWAGKDERIYTTSPKQFVTGKTTIQEALLMLEHPQNVVSLPPHPIFHSEISATVVFNQRVQIFEMPLEQLSNTINIRTVGLPEDANSYRFNITDDNCVYKFDASFATHSHAPFTYTAPCTKGEANQLFSSLHVLRLSANRRTPQLEIVNETTGKALYPAGTQSGDLIGLILRAYPQNNFEVTRTYNILLTFTGDESTGFDVTVSVNGWQVQDESGILTN